MHEADWIKRYIVPLVTADGADALRDDVTLISAPGPIIATMDTLVEGVHFLPTDPIDTVGQKLIRVNVSDIHAKGAEPHEALLSVAWPQMRDEQAFAQLMAGIARDLEDFGIALVGGDFVGTSGPLTLTLTLTGRCIGKAPVRRSGGVAGQGLYLNGEIGWGALGLKAARTQESAVVAHRYQVPRISPLFVAQIVADMASASLDVSDGLLIDAQRLAQASDCGVRIALDRVPFAQDVESIEEMLEFCTAGDDYRVLIAANSGNEIPGFIEIGSLTDSPGMELTVQGQQINPPSTLGFEH